MTLTAHRTALLNRPESVQLHDLRISVPEELEAHVEIWNRDFLQSMQDLVTDAPDPDVYFYHSDHLGSASWITDASLVSADNTQTQYRNGQISNAKRWTNHAIDVIGCPPVGWLAPFAYRLGENYGPSTWFEK